MSYPQQSLSAPPPKRRANALLVGIPAACVALAGVLRLATGGWSGWLPVVIAIAIVAGVVAVAIPRILKASVATWSSVAQATGGAPLVCGFATPQLEELLAATGKLLPGARSGQTRVALALYPQGLQVWAGKPVAPVLTVQWDQTGQIGVGSMLSGTRTFETVAIQTPNGTEVSVLPMLTASLGAVFPADGRAGAHINRIRRMRRR